MPESSEHHHPGVDGHPLGSHTLGPHVVGRRVVVRRILPGETGPSGGPAFTDVLGTCRSWGRGLCEVEREDGTVVAIHLGDIVSGKPVPPRPSVRHRASPREAHLHTLGMWPRVERGRVGDWVLRAGGLLEPDEEHPQGRLVARANSVLAMGDPGMPVAEAAEEVVGFYRAHDQPALAQVVVDDEVDRALTGLGWVPARPGEDDTLFQIAGLARVLRTLTRRTSTRTEAGTGAQATVDEEVDEDGARALVRLGPRARARVMVDGDWAGLHDIWVSPDHRRQGLARAVMAEALDWAAARGATTAYLQVRGDNAPAVALYEAIGFRTHHAYRYLAPPTG